MLSTARWIWSNGWKFWNWYLFPGAGDVRFSLRGTTYKNNSIVTLEDIGENDTALLCMTNLIACCRTPYTDVALGRWLFPNETRVASYDNDTDFYRDREQMVVRLKRRRGGVNGIYRCEIPDSRNVIQTIYIGVYRANTGEWYCTLFKTYIAVLKTKLISPRWKFILYSHVKVGTL